MGWKESPRTLGALCPFSWPEGGGPDLMAARPSLPSTLSFRVTVFPEVPETFIPPGWKEGWEGPLSPHFCSRPIWLL